MESAPARPRVRRSFRRAAIVAFVLLVPFAVHALWDYVEARRLSRAVEDIRGRGEPVHFGRISEGRPVTSEQKQAARYYGAAAILTADAYGPRFTKAAGLIDTLSRDSRPLSPSDSRLSELRSLADSYAPALDLLDRASALDANGLDYASETRYGFPERYIANVNGLRIAERALTGDGEGATSALIATLRLRRAFKDRFALTFPVITMDSVRTLVTFSRPGEPSLRALQQAYQERDDDQMVEGQLLVARGMTIDALWPGAQGELASLPRVRNPRPRPYLFDGFLDTALRPWYTNRLVRMLSLYADAIAASRQPWPAKLDAATALEERYPARRQPSGQQRPSILGRPVFGFFVQGPAADFGRFTRQSAGILTNNRVCMTVLAVERYRRLRGELPQNLETLVPGFLSAVPKDPYTGAPLRYVHSSAEYKVYGAGANRRDDGGDLGVPRSDLSEGARPAANDAGIAVRLQAAPLDPSS